MNLVDVAFFTEQFREVRTCYRFIDNILFFMLFYFLKISLEILFLFVCSSFLSIIKLLESLINFPIKGTLNNAGAEIILQCFHPFFGRFLKVSVSKSRPL